MGKEPAEASAQRRHADGQQTHEKMLNVTGHLENANYLTLVRMVQIKKSRNNKCWQGCGEKGTLIHC